MEIGKKRYSRAPMTYSDSWKQRRSGYEPSDVETDSQDSPLHRKNHVDIASSPETPKGAAFLRKFSPHRHRRRHSSKVNGFSLLEDSAASQAPRGHSSKSASKLRRDDERSVSPTRSNKNHVPFSKPELGRQVHPSHSGKEEHVLHDDIVVASGKWKNVKTSCKEDKGRERSDSFRRLKTAPRPRASDKDQESSYDSKEKKGERNVSALSWEMIRKQRERGTPNSKSSTVGELNEMIANMKMARVSESNDSVSDGTDSVSPSDIFFSREHTAVGIEKLGLGKNGLSGGNRYPMHTKFSQNDCVLHQHSKNNNHIDYRSHRIATSSVSQTTASFRFGSISSDKLRRESTKTSDWSGRSWSFQKLVENRRKSQSETWLSCLEGRACKASNSPERKQHIDEALFIKKATVIESLRPFWADKYQPRLLIGFTCHKREAQLLKQLVLQDSIPHILIRGPSGSGKRSLTVALLGEIFGHAGCKVSHDLRCFQFKNEKPMQVVVPVTSSRRHVELNVRTEANAKYALVGLVREISNKFCKNPEISTVNFEPECTVIVLFDVDKAEESIQYLIKWIMDCFTDACKLIICCKDDTNILDSVKNHCEVIDVEAPAAHEIIEVLIQISRKEDFDLSMSFAAKIAAKSKQNMREAIMALEACKAHNYPFTDDQPIQVGWERVVEELAVQILADPSNQRHVSFLLLVTIREKLQKLLLDFVHPKLILLKLVEQFLKRIEAASKREVYYWHAYYDKRLPTGTTALLKLEEFLAKFMSIHRGSSVIRNYK
ncbi:hypothetical protein K2173_021466 [Erythroxylum novogranatense]|uniref:Replication factor C subunit 3 n=1 Tax=Erythroxylum novogranatense TaxID=1862640 RepID=A0AAV8TY48_9ROSI|nr:hypothetical protein K2173_021466 [Erythroxylum novogranatense]